MWEDFDSAVNKMYQFTNGKKVVLWGYGRSGWFVEHLFKRSNRQIEYIIDDSADMSFKLHLFRSFILENMDKDTVAVLLTFADDERAKKLLERLGYRQGANFIFLRDIFYDGDRDRKLSYYDWLEYKFHVDIFSAEGIDAVSGQNSDGNGYAAGMDYPLIDVLDNFSFGVNDAFFDFGCGKGNIFPLCAKAGIGAFGGVEYNPELFHIACNNLRKLGYSVDGMIKADASLVKKELDEYNYFYIQNSFAGETFDQVIRNIQESHDRKRRKIFLIYAGTYCHENVLKNSKFRLAKTIDTDYWIRHVNIYILPE